MTGAHDIILGNKKPPAHADGFLFYHRRAKTRDLSHEPLMSLGINPLLHPHHRPHIHRHLERELR